ncbi:MULTISPECIES: murein L,D-transpeptidase [Paracoccaceae]|uniref:L,D-transpeptidase family protein n=1 Tax=Paracoccaceae TaxID=31989 RepID=UPI00157364F6|nr:MULTISPECIES: L,D-transpeptidase family protein [Paracoccaceae]MBJ2153453.1 L,D-transpeptidase family protein [Paracoccus sp. IB05]NTT88423.1 L,D-transpeptidase family protein [Tabrizicola sp. SY72]
MSRHAGSSQASRRSILSLMAASGLTGLLPGRALAQTLPAFSMVLAESVADDPGLSAFYRNTNYMPVWTGSEHGARRAAFVTALSQAGDQGLPTGQYDLEGLIAGYHAVSSERDRARIEARTSKLFVRYARDLGSGVLDPIQIIPQIVRTLPRPDVASLMHDFAMAEPAAFIRNMVPSCPEYARLLRSIYHLREKIIQGGWGPAVTSLSLRPGDLGGAVVALRDRLIEMGYLARTAVATYDHRIQTAVARFQSFHGIAATGVADAATLAEINISPEARLRSLTVALERERWLNIPRGQRHIWVNLADFTTQIMDDDLVTLDTVSIIGGRPNDTQTPEFSHQMTYLEVNPDWTLPRSIVARTYWNSLVSGGARQLDVIDSAGRVVPRSSINFSRYTARTFPYSLRQAPGPTNPLGTVKFMFPNPWAIYLHDSPERQLFNNELRAFSAGCIRLREPHEFAYELLSRQSDDPIELFQSTLRSQRQTRIQLEQPVPVHLEYRTAFTTARGGVHFRKDVYDRDTKLYDALDQLGAIFRFS